MANELTLAERIGDLTDRQQRALRQAYRLSGPSGDYFAADLDDCDLGFDSAVAHPVTGRLTDLGLQMRQQLIAAGYRARQS